jgi:hypothetical protein
MISKKALIKTFAALLALALSPLASAADVAVTANITADTTWTKGNDYILDKPIFVTNGATLTIEAGTNIYGTENFDDQTFGSLVITRGSKIEAIGTSMEPIVFTALDERDFGPLTLNDTSLWGGLVILGRAILNDPGNPFLGGNTLNEREIEGFPSGGNTALITYGGLDDTDDSGTLRFVSIRYGGFKYAADNEINGLTLGAVGSGTDISFVEVFNNSDDGIEFFGGTVDTKYMAMAFNEDESFDIDEGYRGRGQFWFAIQKNGGPAGPNQTTGSNYGGEHDGGNGDDKTLEPFARAKVFNATFIGAGAGADDYGQENSVFRLKDNFAGQYHNSVFHDFQDKAIRIDDQNTRDRANSAGDLSFENNTWGDFGASDGTVASLTKNGSAEEIAQLNSKGNIVQSPALVSISREADGGLDPRPQNGSPLFSSSLSDQPADFYTPVPFRGAFGARNWLVGWTHLDELGYVDDSTYIEEPKAVVDPVGGYAVWAAINLAGETMDAKGDDPNNDGISNLISFAFGVDPLTGAGRENLPTVSGDTVTFTRSTDDSLTFTYEVSTDLSAWQTAVEGTDYTETISPNGDLETVTLTLLGIGSDLRIQLFRVRVTD